MDRTRQSVKKEGAVLQRLEHRLLELDRRFSTRMRADLAALNASSRERLRFVPVEDRAMATPEPRRLRFEQTDDPLDRLVLTNWNPTVGFVSLGEFQLELDPGQSAVLWLGRNTATPDELEGGSETRAGSLYMLPDACAAII